MVFKEYHLAERCVYKKKSRKGCCWRTKTKKHLWGKKVAETEVAYSADVLAKWLLLKKSAKVELWDVFDVQNRGYITTIWAVQIENTVWWMQVGTKSVFRSHYDDLLHYPTECFRLMVKERSDIRIEAVCKRKKKKIMVLDLFKMRNVPMSEEYRIDCKQIPCCFEKLIVSF